MGYGTIARRLLYEVALEPCERNLRDANSSRDRLLASVPHWARLCGLKHPEPKILALVPMVQKLLAYSSCPILPAVASLDHAALRAGDMRAVAELYVGRSPRKECIESLLHGLYYCSDTHETDAAACALLLRGNSTARSRIWRRMKAMQTTGQQPEIWEKLKSALLRDPVS